jgi:hypothetical protein
VSNLRKAAEQAHDVGWITLRLLRAESKYPVLVLIAELDKLCDALRAALAEPDEVAAAVEAEREACAKKAERWDAFHPDSNYGHCIAKLIRERDET